MGKAAIRKERIRTLRDAARALTPVPPADPTKRENVYLLVPDWMDERDDKLREIAIALGCNAIWSGPETATYHHLAKLEGADLSGPVIYRHVAPPHVPTAEEIAQAQEERIAALEALVAEMRADRRGA